MADDEPVAESPRRGLLRHGFHVDWVAAEAVGPLTSSTIPFPTCRNEGAQSRTEGVAGCAPAPE
nr:hypothetical protein OG999_24710 [Streptomyces sp. NBC_00886]